MIYTTERAGICSRPFFQLLLFAPKPYTRGLGCAHYRPRRPGNRTKRRAGRTKRRAGRTKRRAGGTRRREQTERGAEKVAMWGHRWVNRSSERFVPSGAISAFGAIRAVSCDCLDSLLFWAALSVYYFPIIGGGVGYPSCEVVEIEGCASCEFVFFHGVNLFTDYQEPSFFT